MESNQQSYKSEVEDLANKLYLVQIELGQHKEVRLIKMVALCK